MAQEYHQSDFGELKDPERAKFLEHLDSAPFEVSEWEAKFIESTLGKSRFSQKQRDIIDDLMTQYSGRL